MYGMGDKIKAKIKFRRSEGWDLKPESESMDGKEFPFSFGWLMDEDDTGIYVGEIAWILDTKEFPQTNFSWVASGDLTEVRDLQT